MLTLSPVLNLRRGSHLEGGMWCPGPSASIFNIHLVILPKVAVGVRNLEPTSPVGLSLLNNYIDTVDCKSLVSLNFSDIGQSE